MSTGRPVGNPTIGHTAVVLGIAFTADGNYIVSRGADDGWMLWPGPNSWRDEWKEWVSPTIEYRRPCPTLDVPE